MSPSEEKRILFCASDRLIRSFVAVQVMVFVSGCWESQPDLWGFGVSFLLCFVTCE